MINKMKLNEKTMCLYIIKIYFNFKDGKFSCFFNNILYVDNNIFYILQNNILANIIHKFNEKLNIISD
jgi:hypothetical protein